MKRFFFILFVVSIFSIGTSDAQSARQVLQDEDYINYVREAGAVLEANKDVNELEARIDLLDSDVEIVQLKAVLLKKYPRILEEGGDFYKELAIGTVALLNTSSNSELTPDEMLLVCVKAAHYTGAMIANTTNNPIQGTIVTAVLIERCVTQYEASTD